MKKTIITTVLVALCISIIFAQTGDDKEKYNSVCIFANGSMETSLTSQLSTLSHYATANGYGWKYTTASGSVDGEVSQGDSMVLYNPYTDHIIKIDEKIATAGSAYATPMGYFTYATSLPYSIDGLSEGRLLSFVSFDKLTKANVVYDSANEKPIRLVVNATTIRLTYLGDECTINLLGEDGKTLTKIGTKAMSSSSMADYIAANNADNDLTVSVCRLLAAAESSSVSYPSEVNSFINQVQSLLSLTCSSYESEENYNLPSNGESFAFISDMTPAAKEAVVLDSVVYKTGAIWEEAHDNLPLLYYPYVERIKYYSNDSTSTDTFMDYGHPVESNLGTGLSSAGDSYPITFSFAEKKEYTDENGNLDYKTVEDSVILNKREKIVNDSIVRIIHSMVVPNLTKVYTKERDEGYLGTMLGDYNNYAACKLYSDTDSFTLTETPQKTITDWEEDTRATGWYFASIVYEKSLKIYYKILEKVNPNEYSEVTFEWLSIRPAYYDMFLVIDGKRITFKNYYTEEWNTEITDVNDENGIGKKIVYECRSKLFGRNFYIGFEETVYQRK